MTFFYIESSSKNFYDLYLELRSEIKSYFNIIERSLNHSYHIANLEISENHFKLPKKAYSKIESFEDVINSLFKDLGINPESLGINKYTKMKKILTDIYFEKSSAKIICTQNPSFKKNIFIDILLLLSKRTGRKLLFKVFNQEQTFEIKETQLGSFYRGRNDAPPEICINQTPCGSLLAKTEKGDFFLAPHPRFIGGVFHEITHLFHERIYGKSSYRQCYKSPPTLHIDYDYLEEQITIEGETGGCIFLDQKEIKPSICENNVLREWGLEQSLRFSHRSLILSPDSNDPELPFKAAGLKANLDVSYHKDQRFSDGSLLIHHLIESRKILMAKFLIENGCKLDVSNNKQILPIHLAAKIGNQELICLILEKFPNQANITDNNGNTLIHYALQGIKYFENNLVEIIKLLIDKGCPIDLPNHQGELPIHLAVKNTSKEVVSTILEKFPEHIDAIDDFCNTPISLAIFRDWNNRLLEDNDERICNLAQFLMEHGCKMDIPDSDGKRPIHTLAALGTKEDIALGIKMSLDYLNSLDNFHNIALYYAIERYKNNFDESREDNLEIIKQFIRHKNRMDIRKKNLENQSPLDCAKELENKKVARWLVGFEKIPN